MSSTIHAEPRAVKWELGRDDKDRRVYLESVEQRDGSLLYAVRKGGFALTTEGLWEYEPIPSSRDDAFLARARYATSADAIAQYRAVVGRAPTPEAPHG